MPFVTEYLADGARLVLSGDVGVAEAAALHAALVELAATDGCVTVDESRLHGSDVTLLQLVLAFARARRAACASAVPVRPGMVSSVRTTSYALGIASSEASAACGSENGAGS